MDPTAFVVATKRRWVGAGLPDYPLWIAGLIDTAALVTAVVAVAQRPADQLLPAAGLMAVAVLPWLLELWLLGRAWPAFVVLTGGAVATLLVAYPVEYEFVPFLLIVMAGHATAVAGVWRGLAVMAVGVAVVAFAGVQGEMAGAEVGIWSAGIVVGVDLGFIMRMQQLRLEAQEREHAVRERQAVLEERQRIAREVHDLVAHSLSVTMLHLTAARRDVADAADDGADLRDALESLTAAERVGRRAMADIRSTVHMLGEDDQDQDHDHDLDHDHPGTRGTRAAPDLTQLDALVADFQRAGLEVACETRGDLAGVAPATALGLYRIVQESLANVAKHAPGSRARLRLDLAAEPPVLTVTNELADPQPAVRRTGGSGLSGMAARADQLGAALTAGPRERAWEVRVVLPARDRAGVTEPA